MFGMGVADFFIPITAIFLVIGLPVLCVTYLIAIRLRRGGLRERDRAQWEEETRIMQEMHDNLSKMETRIEALETILMERFGKDDK
jgi:phage shock protein B